MTGLTIEQLADLKIAISKNQSILDANTKKNEELEARNEHLVKNSRELEKSIDLQVKRLDDAKAENKKIKEEKDGILSKFAVENEKQYKELRERERVAANDEQQNALRLIEIDKREAKIGAKEVSNAAVMSEAKLIKKEAKDERTRAEKRYLDVTAQKKELILMEETIAEKKEALESIKKDIEDRNNEVRNQEAEILSKSQINQNLVVELANKEKNIAIKSERLEKLTTLFNELKDFVINNSDMDSDRLSVAIQDFITQEEKEMPDMSEDIEEPPVEIPDGSEALKKEAEEVEDVEVEKDPAILSEMGYHDLRKEVKARGLPLKQNVKKEELIELLSK